jgi:hypothetical protein
MYYFNILRIPVQHFGYIVSKFQHGVLKLAFWNVELVYAKYWEC